MSRLEKYPEYKDSGVEWLGEIPLGWEVKKLFGLCNFIRGNSSFSKDELLNIGKYVALQYGKTYKVNEIDEKYKFYVNDEFYKSSQIVNFGDTIFISTSETIEDLGHSAYYKRNDLGLLGGEQILLKPKVETVESKYLYFSSKVFSKELKKFATGIKVFRFNIDNLKTIYMPIPPKQEQQKITNYLDKKIAKIDKAISLKEQIIERLKERRQILINDAVTRGIDKNVKMKDSGVEWIGKISEHWEVKKLKYVMKDIQTGTTPTTSNPKYFNGNIDWFNPKDLNDEILIKAEKNISEKAIQDGEIKLFEADSILIIGIGATTGKTSYLTKQATFNQQITGFKSKQHYNKYLFYQIKNFSNLFLNIANYTTLPILNNEFFKSFILILPPLQEQKQIVEFIENQTLKIDNAINLQQKQIEKLKEYKTTLIDSVVTGKVRVL